MRERNGCGGERQGREPRGAGSGPRLRARRSHAGGFRGRPGPKPITRALLKVHPEWFSDSTGTIHRTPVSLLKGSRRPRRSVARHGTRLTRPKPQAGAVLRQEGGSMADAHAQIKFDAPPVLRKWPSLNNKRISSAMAYLVAEGTLDECIRQFTSKPVSQLHFYEIHTAPQGELVTAVLSAEQIIELARLRDFL